MQENTNKAIALNSVINYVKMGINTILALLTTRFALQALGIDDFGLFSVLGSVIAFIGIFNSTMISTCIRFISVAVGKGDILEINKQFNVNLVIFLFLALIMLIVACPLGFWYIHYYLNYNGPVGNALMVFVISVTGSIASTLATPYNGFLIAKERFIVFGVVEVISHVIRFIVALLLLNHFDNKLFVYSITMACMAALPTVVYCLYCNLVFKDYVKWSFVKDKQPYKHVLSFSAWVSYGAVAFIARNQGAAVLVNMFFSTAMNTALGLANSLIAYIQLFANNLTQPIAPQITKSYVVGNLNRTNELLVMSTKFSFILMLFVGTPFLVEGDWILSLWLGEVPPYVVPFSKLLIIDCLIASFNSGLSVLLFASGKIVLYQILINTLRLLSIIVGYFVLKSGAAPEMLFVTYIVFSILITIATQYCLHVSLHYDISPLIRKSYMCSLEIVIFMLPFYLFGFGISPILSVGLSIAYLTLLIYMIGLSNSEKSLVINICNKRVVNNK